MTYIRGKKTLITGAARGMGRRMAEEFARRGAELLLVDIDEDELQLAVDDLAGHGVTVHSFVRDLSDREEIWELHKTVAEEVGRIDILVNNAGVVTGGTYEDIDADADQLMMDVNINAVHWMTKAFLPDLKQGADTHLVQLASAAGLVGVPKQVIYCASKWFVTGFSEALRLELKGDGFDHVGISVICPGFVDTGMFDGAKPPMLMPMLQPEYVVDRIMDAVEEERFYVQEPLLVKLTPALRALLPQPVVDTIMDVTGATSSMQGWKGRKKTEPTS